MKNLLLLALVFITTILTCVAQSTSDINSLRKKAYQLIQDQGYLEKGIEVFGFHHKQIPENNIKDGIYGIYTKLSGIVNYFIYENEELVLLDSQTFDKFITSTKQLITYLLNKGYCQEIIIDYLKRFTRHYYRNKYILNRKQFINCVETKEIEKSIFTLDYLTSEIKKKSPYNSGYIIINHINGYCIEKEDFLNVGIYRLELLNKDIYPNILIVYNNTYNIYQLRNEEDLIPMIQDVLNFNDKKLNHCELAISILNNALEETNIKTCFEEYTKELP